MVAFIGTVSLVVLTVAATAALVYLFLRANPNKKATIDKAVDEVSKRL